MRDRCVSFWCLLLVVLFTSLFAGCDVEYLEYEDDDTYALFDRPGMAPTAAQVQEAVAIIAAGAPVNDIPGAYSILMDLLDVTVDSDDISPFVLAMADPNQYISLYGLDPNVVGDADGSGKLDTDDIDEFVIIVTTSAVPEPLTLSLLAIGGAMFIRRKRR